jgi:hypothetical protein
VGYSYLTRLRIIHRTDRRMSKVLCNYSYCVHLMLLPCVTNCVSSIVYIFNLVAESVTNLTILLFVMLECLCVHHFQHFL